MFYSTTSVVWFDLVLIQHSNFVATREPVKLLPRGSREDLGKPRATVSQIFSFTTTWGQ